MTADEPHAERLRCLWSTWAGRSYFANLKVMRLVLGALRDHLNREGCVLCAYVFVEDRVLFVTEGPGAMVEAALERTRVETETSFARSDRKPLWGEHLAEPVSSLGRDEILLPLRRAPVETGVAEDLRDYPWAGGGWLFPGT